MGQQLYRENVYHDGLEGTPFISILSGTFWAVVNTTTLKYAIASTSFGGRFITIVFSYVSVFMVSLPIPIVTKIFGKQHCILFPDQDELLMLGGPFLASAAAASATAAARGEVREKEERGIDSSGSFNSSDQSCFADGGRRGGRSGEDLPAQSWSPATGVLGGKEAARPTSPSSQALSPEIRNEHQTERIGAAAGGVGGGGGGGESGLRAGGVK